MKVGIWKAVEMDSRKGSVECMSRGWKGGRGKKKTWQQRNDGARRRLEFMIAQLRREGAIGMVEDDLGRKKS